MCGEMGKKCNFLAGKWRYRFLASYHYSFNYIFVFFSLCLKYKQFFHFFYWFVLYFVWWPSPFSFYIRTPKHLYMLLASTLQFLLVFLHVVTAFRIGNRNWHVIRLQKTIQGRKKLTSKEKEIYFECPAFKK